MVSTTLASFESMSDHNVKLNKTVMSCHVTAVNERKMVLEKAEF